MKEFIKKSRILFLFVGFTSCFVSFEKEEKPFAFEDHLVPSIQVKNELRLYNLEDRMKHYNVPGVQVVVVKNGNVVLNKGYGISRSDDSTRVNAKTIFQAGSISKSITAVTVMKLVEKNILDLDKNVDEYLKDWKIPENKFTKDIPITLRMLLSHTSGMNNSNHPGFPQEGYLPKVEELLKGYERYKKVDFDTFPKVRYKYSNTGYAVIQKIIEDVTKKSFHDVATEEVLKPLQMTNSSFIPRRYNANEKEVSYAYNRQGKLISGYWFNASAATSGGLWTTAEDLTKFLVEFQKSIESNTGIISQKDALSMITRVKANYGLGFDIKNDKDSIVFYHTGKNRGFTNVMMASKKGGNAIVVLTNGDNGGYLFSEIIRGISDLTDWGFMKPKELETIVVSKDILKSYEGVYKAEIGGTVYSLEIKLVGEHIQLIDLDEDNETYPLRALTETKFRDIDDGEKVDFIKNEKGEVILLWDEEYEFKRVR